MEILGDSKPVKQAYQEQPATPQPYYLREQLIEFPPLLFP